MAFSSESSSTPKRRHGKFFVIGSLAAALVAGVGVTGFAGSDAAADETTLTASSKQVTTTVDETKATARATATKAPRTPQRRSAPVATSTSTRADATGAATAGAADATLKTKRIKGSLAIPAKSGTGRRVIYSIGQQRVWTVERDGSLDRTYLVSGQVGQPNPGTYAVFSKSRHATSAVAPPATMQYMIRFARGKRTGSPIGFHDIPREISNGKPEQTEAQLGQPLSAGCVRQKTSDARYLWGFAGVGTKVVVV